MVAQHQKVQHRQEVQHHQQVHHHQQAKIHGNGTQRLIVLLCLNFLLLWVT